MNKKFSTLVASLLFASAFSAFAGTAAPMFTAPNGVETRALVPSKDAVKGADAGIEAIDAAGVLNGFTNNARLQVFGAADGLPTSSASGDVFFVSLNGTLEGTEVAYDGSTAANAAAFYWTLDGDRLVDANGAVLSLAGEQNFDIVPLVKADGKTKTPYFVLRVASGTNKGKFVNFTKSGSDDTAGAFALSAGANAVTEAAAAGIFASIETAYTNAADGDALNEDLKDGFNLSVSFGTATLKGAELFAGKLTAMTYSSSAFAVATSETTVYLKNKDGKYIVFDKDLYSSNAVKGGFKLVSVADAKKLADASNADATFEIKKADNGSKIVEVSVDGKRLYVNVSNGTNVLTATTTAPNTANWATTSLGATNDVDFKKFLTGQYYKVSFVKKATGAEDADIAYKINGVLGLRYNTTEAAAKADYVKSADVVAEDPATMWAPSIVDDELVLKNRENTTETVTIASLREVSAGVYEVGSVTESNIGVEEGEQVKITPVASVTKTDGYKVYAEEVLKNTAFYLGQSRRNADGDVPAYWAENHGTHQIGATVNQTEATQWKVELIKKEDADYNTQIDSVLVVSTLSSYNTTTGVITETPDTLAVLPYVFQNKENREYVKLNTEVNQLYYICDENNKDNSRKDGISFFALKKKPGDTYNYVTLNLDNEYTDGAVDPVEAIDGESKVYLKNSANKGTWEDVELYSDDANSLMIVDPVDAPEYRKVKKEWGDIVKIYREEYPTEVLFEKRDAKSVVDKDTLSFLNVNNSVTGANPALFVDTAYVNRTVNGVDNTCYQYLLAVNVGKESEVVCPYNPEHNTQAWRDEHGGPCADAKENPAVVKGRFLINLIDTAYAYKQDHLHNNPYINMVEADENLAKLSFVEGIHIKDTLFITRKGGEVVKLRMDDPAFNVAKFAFRYVDNEAGSFKIQTQSKLYDKNTLKEFNESAHNEGYLRWVNGTVVVTNKYTNGEVFNMEENFDGQAVANEDITASSISVIAKEGAVVIAGAQGKKVTISNVLGQTVANAVLSSDKAEISTPSGVVIVAVEGEAAVKAIVK
ncbi:MAG: DUF6383 domain-containing protein [Parabacteroides gordonii]|uniref:DUF6383 domain-containing protein n=1 Tax=Parabacteroides gordonii TaxID=574930 RepID=UPI003A8ABE16